MNFTRFAITGVAALFLLVPVRAQAAKCCDMACCDHNKAAMSCCDQAKAAMPCCEEAKAAMPCCEADLNKDINVLAQLPIDTQIAEPPVQTADPQLAPEPPVRQLTEVFFQRPTFVGRSILQGRYVIEHDNARMARGEPCTYIYAFNDRTKPVVTVHCTHIERERAGQNVVVLQSKGDTVVMDEFQFAGETAAHGIPPR